MAKKTLFNLTAVRIYLGTIPKEKTRSRLPFKDDAVNASIRDFILSPHVSVPEVPFDLQIIGDEYFAVLSKEHVQLLHEFLASANLNHIWIRDVEFLNPGKLEIQVQAKALTLIQCAVAWEAVKALTSPSLKALSVRNSEVTDFMLPVPEWPLLQALDLSFSENLLPLVSLVPGRNMRSLWIQGLSGHGVFSLEPCKSLKEFAGGWDAPIGREGIKWLSGCENLTSFFISSAFGDLGPLDPLCQLRNLKSLDVSSCNISNEDMLALTCHSRLRRLSINDNPISTTGFCCVEKLQELRYLGMSGISASKCGLEQLRMPNLRTIDCIIGCPEDNLAITHFQAAHPKVKVYYP